MKKHDAITNINKIEKSIELLHKKDPYSKDIIIKACIFNLEDIRKNLIKDVYGKNATITPYKQKLEGI